MSLSTRFILVYREYNEDLTDADIAYYAITKKAMSFLAYWREGHCFFSYDFPPVGQKGHYFFTYCSSPWPRKGFDQRGDVTTRVNTSPQVRAHHTAKTIEQVCCATSPLLVLPLNFKHNAVSYSLSGK